MSPATSLYFLRYIIVQNRMEMDTAKVSAITSWPIPEAAAMIPGVHPGYSTVAVPLAALTSSMVLFCWSQAVDEAFQHLKSRFSSAPILLVADPTRQFVVEVDASDVGVGAVLSQRSAEDKKLPPCAFFSRHLSPA